MLRLSRKQLVTRSPESMRPSFPAWRHTTANNPPPADQSAEDWRDLEQRCRDVVSRQSQYPRNRDLACCLLLVAEYLAMSLKLF